MAKKQNPILAAFEAKKEAEFSQRLGKNTEINLIAMLIAGNDLGFLGEIRAGLLLEAQLETKMRLADALLTDAEDDKELAYTKADWARRLIQILGADNWPRYQHLFPLLRDYWVPGGEPNEEG